MATKILDVNDAWPAKIGDRPTDRSGGWDDLQGDVQEGNAVASLTLQNALDTDFPLLHFRHDQDDTLHMRFQTTHGWNPATPLRLHMHLLFGGTPASPRNVRFTVKYAFVRNDAAFPLNSAWTTDTVDVPVPVDYGGQTKVVSLIEVTPPDEALESDLLLATVTRAGTDPADTYTDSNPSGTSQANLAVVALDVHYRRHKLGTASFAPGVDA
jgi:hypothetical protein